MPIAQRFNGFGSPGSVAVNVGDQTVHVIQAPNAPDSLVQLTSLSLSCVKAAGTQTAAMYAYAYILVGTVMPIDSGNPVIVSGWPSIKQLADASYRMPWAQAVGCSNSDFGKEYTFNEGEIEAKSGEQIVVVCGGLIDAVAALTGVNAVVLMAALGRYKQAIAPAKLR